AYLLTVIEAAAAPASAEHASLEEFEAAMDELAKGSMTFRSWLRKPSRVKRSTGTGADALAAGAEPPHPASSAAGFPLPARPGTTAVGDGAGRAVGEGRPLLLHATGRPSEGIRPGWRSHGRIHSPSFRLRKARSRRIVLTASLASASEADIPG